MCNVFHLVYFVVYAVACGYIRLDIYHQYDLKYCCLCLSLSFIQAPIKMHLLSLTLYYSRFSIQFYLVVKAHCVFLLLISSILVGMNNVLHVDECKPKEEQKRWNRKAKKLKKKSALALKQIKTNSETERGDLRLKNICICICVFQSKHGMKILIIFATGIFMSNSVLME